MRSTDDTPATDATITADGRVEVIGDRAIVRLPADASSALPSRGQVAAQVRVDGRAIRTVLEPDGRRGHWLGLDANLVRELTLTAGDRVELAIAPVRQWPEPDVPDDLRSALDDAPDLAGTWSDLTPMARWEWVRWVSATRSPATRERRVEVSIDKLRSGKRRPCCFDLSSCTDPELSRGGRLVDPA